MRFAQRLKHYRWNREETRFFKEAGGDLSLAKLAYDIECSLEYDRICGRKTIRPNKQGLMLLAIADTIRYEFSLFSFLFLGLYAERFVDQFSVEA